MKGHKLTIIVSLISLLVLSGFSKGAVAEEAGEEVNLSSTIVGNQEQPKVLYIVPWQSVDASELEKQTIQSQLDLVFGHVEPVELRRELRYLKEMSKESGDE